MLSRILISVIIGFVSAASLFAQPKSNSKNLIHYRLLMTSINIEDVQPDEISISLNAFNTGRKPVDLSEFNSIPEEMEIKFEESFYRSSLSGLENEIRNGLINKNIVIPNGKILRNIRFNLPSNAALYKQLTKKERRFTKNYTPKKRNNKAAELKYKTSDKKLNPPPSFIAKNKKKKSKSNAITKEEKVAAAKKSSTPNANNSNSSTINSKIETDLQKERKEKEMAALETKEKKRKELEMKTKEMEAQKMKEKEMTALEMKEKESKALEIKNKEMEAQKMKEKEMAALEMKEKESKELEIKAKEMEAQKMKEKEMAEQDVTLETDQPKKKERLSIIERQKLKRQEREEAKQNEYKIEKASQKEDEKAILESLGVGNSKDSKSNSEGGVAFDTRASVEASKNSYAEKEVCPDLVLNSINVLKKSKNWVTLEYTLTNKGKGPANLGKDNNGQGIALRAFLSSSENISRGALPLGGGFVDYGKEGQLFPNNSHTGTLKLDIRKMTRFTPYVIINLDPFNVIEECDKTNNYGNVKVGG